MTIEDLFEEIKRKVKKGNYSLSALYADPDSYGKFRRSYGTILKEEDEAYLISISEEEEWAGFVPNVVNVLEEFSENILEAIIKSAIIRYSPVLEYAFVPCIRVFGILKVDEILIRYLLNGTNNEKRGVLRAFYFARPTISGRSYRLNGNSNWTKESFGYKFQWDEVRERYIWIGNNGRAIDKIQMTAEEFINYCSIVRQYFLNRQEGLFKAFKYSENRYMQLLFVSNIEGGSKRFHPGLKMEIEEYFILKCQRKIPGNSKELSKHVEIERGKKYFKTLFK